MAVRLRGRVAVKGVGLVFFPSLYIFMFNSYFIFYNRGNFSQGSRHSAITGTWLLILLLFHLGGEKPSPTRGLELPPAPLSPAGLLASTSSPHEISNFLHSRRSHIVAIFFFRSSFFTAATSVIGKKKIQRKNTNSEQLQILRKQYIYPHPPFTAFSKNGCTISPQLSGETNQTAARTSQRPISRRFLEKWRSQNGPSGVDSSSRFWGDHQHRPARETTSG